MHLQDLKLYIYKRKGELDCLGKGRKKESRMWYFLSQKESVREMPLAIKQVIWNMYLGTKGEA